MGRCRMAPLADASAASLHQFVTDHLEPGATVVTDGWQGYRGLDRLGYSHVRHSQRAARFRGEDPGKLASYFPPYIRSSRWPSGGCSAPIRGPRTTHIWPATSTSSCSASIVGVLAAGGRCSFGFSNSPSPTIPCATMTSSPAVGRGKSRQHRHSCVAARRAWRGHRRTARGEWRRDTPVKWIPQTRETDVREDVGSGRGGGRDERADGAPLAERCVAVDGEGAADVADAGGPVRQRVAVGGRAATGGRYGGPAAGADAVHGAVPAASGALSAWPATDVAAAGSRVAGAGRSGARGVFRAGGGSGAGSGVRLHGRELAEGDDSGRAVPAPVVRVGAELQPVDVCGAGAERDVRGAGVRPSRCAVDAGRGAGRASSRQSVGGDARAEAQWRAPVDSAVPAGAGALRAGLVADPAGEAARERRSRAVALPDEDGHRAGVAVAGRQRLRGRAGVSALRAGGCRSGAEYAGGGAAGRGTGVSAAVAGGEGSGVHDVSVQREAAP